MACTVFRTCTLCEATRGLRFEVEGPPMASPSADLTPRAQGSSTSQKRRAGARGDPIVIRRRQDA